MARAAGTVSSSCETMDFSTRRFASSGSHASIDSSRRSVHSSTSIMAATAVIGLVSDAMRKIASRRMGAGFPRDIVPSVST